MDLDGYQRAAYTTAQRFPTDKTDPVLMPLLRLGATAGTLMGEYERTGREDGDLDRFKEVAVKELGGVLWYAAGLASRLDLRLTEVARLNLMRNRARWQPPSDHFTLFDDYRPSHEQLPRQFTVRFTTVTVDGRERVRMQLDGKPVGDPLTDNAYEDIGYRYHDVCHLANVAVLGWSPVIRALLKRKRKSDSLMDEVEDGGRAIVIEEGIGSLVFAHARQARYFKGAARVDGALLSTIASMAAGLEVEARTPADWERCILTGYSVWRELRAAGSGLVTGDMHARTLQFTPLPEAEQ